MISCVAVILISSFSTISSFSLCKALDIRLFIDSLCLIVMYSILDKAGWCTAIKFCGFKECQA